MRLLVDANLSPSIARGLVVAGYEASHVVDVGLVVADDAVIFDHAATSDAVLVTADSDFAMLLALRRAVNPSVIHLRHVANLAPDRHLDLLLAALPSLVAALEAGAIVSLSPTRVAIRDLPIR